MTSVRKTRTPAAVTRQLMSLAAGEAVSVVVFFFFLFISLEIPYTVVNLAGFTATAVTLLVGATYWLAKRHQVRTRSRTIASIRVFRTAQKALLLLLAGATVVIIHQFATEPRLDELPGAALLLFGAVEYVNYFHWQIAPGGRPRHHLIMPHRWPVSHLARDLDRSEPAPPRRRSQRFLSE